MHSKIILVFLGLQPFVPLMAHALYGTAEMGQGFLRGYIQTPKGGTIGTTSYERPSFQELHQQFDHFTQVSAGLKWFSSVLEGNALFLQPTAQGILNTGLITHAQTIPTYSNFDMQVHFDWYTLAMGKVFGFFSDTWTLMPRLEGNWLHYAYDFRSTTALTAAPVQSRRAFTLITAGVGLDLSIMFNDRWTGFAQAKCNLPISNFHYVKANIGLSYCLWEVGCAHLLPYVKLGIIRIDYEDEQPVPNHIRYTNFPFISLGFSLIIGSNTGRH